MTDNGMNHDKVVLDEADFKGGKACPHCKKPVNWLGQLKQWNDEYGEDWASEAMIAIMCESCGEYAFAVEIFAVEETEEIYSPALKAKVKVPKALSSNG